MKAAPNASMADAAPPDAPEEEADPVLRSAMAKLEQAALRYDSVRDKQSLRAFDGASMNAASFQQQLQRAFPSLRLSEPEAYALLACFDNDGGGTIDGAEFMKTFFSRSFAIKADGDRAARDAKAARAAREVRKQQAAARAKRAAMDARYDANFSDEDMLVARRRISGQHKRANFPTSKAPISAVCHSFRLIFGRAIISRNGLEAWMLFLERARAERSR